MNIPMVDTLCITVDIKEYGIYNFGNPNKQDFVTYLENEKAEAKALSRESMNYKHIVQLGTQTFQLLPNGSRGHAYILHNDKYEVKLSQHRSSKESFYPVYIKIKQEYLWQKGVNQSWTIIKEWITNTIGEIKDNKVSRIDICCHTDELQLKAEDIETFEGRYHLDTIYRFKRQISNMCFGSGSTGKILCRIYNKTLEVTQKKQKLWFFDIWSSKGLDPHKVWNVEFEIARDFLKEVNINTVEETLNNLRSLWDYCTKEWLIKKSLDKTRIERCSTASEWESIQKAFDKFVSTSLIEREKQQQASAFALLPGTIGNITSFGARAEITDIEHLFEIIKTQGTRYLSKKELCYEDVIDKKISLMTN